MKNPAHILVCDDDEAVLLVTSFALESEGFIVETAKRTDEIFLKLNNVIKPLLILLDFNLPEAGGASVIQQLRNSDDTRNIPIILFSGEEKLEEIAATLKVDGFLRKPFDIVDLKKIVQKFIQNDS